MQTLIYNLLHRPTLGEFRVVPRSRVVTGVSLYGVSVRLKALDQGCQSLNVYVVFHVRKTRLVKNHM